jgi:hypothetical protein
MSIVVGKAVGLLSLAGLAVALAACGGGDPAAAEADAATKAEAARLRFERCLRENGVEIKTSDGGRRTQVRVDETKDRAAMQKCRKYQLAAFGAITPEQRQEFEDAATKFAACMRQHGVDLPDPVRGGAARSRQGPARAGARIEKASPTTQAAMKACEDKLPRGGAVRLAGPGAPR